MIASLITMIVYKPAQWGRTRSTDPTRVNWLNLISLFNQLNQINQSNQLPQ